MNALVFYVPDIDTKLSICTKNKTMKGKLLW